MAVFELKQLSPESIPSALEKAIRYRLLNQPWEAENIYLDVLQTDPDNREALVGLLLAITDQFHEGLPGSVRRAREVLSRLQDEYERAYYAGIICERRAKALLQQSRPGAGEMAHELLEQARGWYEQAERLRPPGNDDALLRWNACVRLSMRRGRVGAAPEERYQPYAD
jgi:hypothetical protein